jgi:hypothetical protein
MLVYKNNLHAPTLELIRNWQMISGHHINNEVAVGMGTSYGLFQPTSLPPLIATWDHPNEQTNTTEKSTNECHETQKVCIEINKWHAHDKQGL